MTDPRAMSLGIAALCAIMLSGVALGRFVTGNTHVSWYASGGGATGHRDVDVGNPDAAYPALSDNFLPSPTEPVVCKGCGPGINDRMQGSFAFGYDDAVVRDYLANDAPDRPDPIDYASDPLPVDSDHDAGPLSRPVSVEPAGQQAAPATPAPAAAPAQPNSTDTPVSAEPLTAG